MSRIPPDAKCVFKGIIFDVWQWPQTMFDGSVEIFEGIRRSSTVSVFALDGNDILYCRQQQPDSKPFLSLFGGRIDAGEAPLEAAKRELLEESGLASDDWILIHTYTSPGKIEWQNNYFVARDCRKVTEPRPDAGEKIECLRAPLAEFLTRIVADPAFRGKDLKQELFSALDPAKAEALTALLLGKSKNPLIS
jgi:ADP-ribose pyrophosphatase